MISREEHLKQINRFHDELERIDKEIQLGTGDQYNLLRRYFQLTSKLWPTIDDCIDKVKYILDFLHDNKEIQ